MYYSISRQNFGMYSLGFLLLLVAMGISKLFTVSSMEAPKEITEKIRYVMPRPTHIASGDFDLSDREIESEYINRFKTEGTTSSKKNINADKVNKNLKTKKQSKKDLKKYVRTHKRKGVSVNVVNNLRESNHEYKNSDGSRYETYNQSYVNSKYARYQTQNADEQDTDGALIKDKKDSSSIVNLVLSEPTKENLNKLLQEFQNGNIKANAFYSTTEELLRRNDPELQERALNIVMAVNSLNSFAQVVEVSGRLPTSLKPKVESYFVSFSKLPKLLIINLALRHQNPAVVMKALQVLNIAVQSPTSVAANTTNSGATTVNGTGSGSNSAQLSSTASASTNSTTTKINFHMFEINLNYLASGSDKAIANMAQEILTKISSLN